VVIVPEHLGEESGESLTGSLQGQCWRTQNLSGFPISDTEQTLYRWEKQYQGLETDHVRQFRQLQEENARLKRLMAELSLDKKAMTPSRRRPVVSYLHDTYRVTAPPATSACEERRACRVARIPVSTFRYQSRQEPKTAACGFGRSRWSGYAMATARP